MGDSGKSNTTLYDKTSTGGEAVNNLINEKSLTDKFKWMEKGFYNTPLIISELGSDSKLRFKLKFITK